jgi:hypothetical protein
MIVFTKLRLETPNVSAADSIVSPSWGIKEILMKYGWLGIELGIICGAEIAPLRRLLCAAVAGLKLTFTENPPEFP